MKVTTWFLAAAVACMAVPATQAAILYNTPGSTYTQNFDSLPNTPTDVSLGASPLGWTNDNASPPVGNFSIVGFHLFHPTNQAEGGANGKQRMRIGAGSANTGAFMSYGSSGSTDRALGALSSNTLSPANGESYYGARITNNTGVTLVEFTLSYTGEQWRDGGTTTTGSVAQTTSFDYSLNATSIEDALATYTNETALDFVSPVFGATAGAAKDGNLAANRTVKGPVTVTGLNWLPGTDLWLRWTDINDAGNDHGLAIDDLSFSAEGIPEPGTFALAALAGLVSLAVRRRS